eukprot:Amastigsp_a515282_167.p2 type:complete len:125 gc:universal Amastigsp_a515282_167:128-502(+)
MCPGCSKRIYRSSLTGTRCLCRASACRLKYTPRSESSRRAATRVSSSSASIWGTVRRRQSKASTRTVFFASPSQRRTSRRAPLRFMSSSRASREAPPRSFWKLADGLSAPSVHGASLGAALRCE